MADKERVPAMFAVNWKIERGPGPDGSDFVGLTFTDVKGNASRVILHPKEAAAFSAALAADLASKTT